MVTITVIIDVSDVGIRTCSVWMSVMGWLKLGPGVGGHR